MTYPACSCMMRSALIAALEVQKQWGPMSILASTLLESWSFFSLQEYTSWEVKSFFLARIYFCLEEEILLHLRSWSTHWSTLDHHPWFCISFGCSRMANSFKQLRNEEQPKSGLEWSNIFFNFHRLPSKFLEYTLPRELGACPEKTS